LIASLATKVAKAEKEGGFLGFGGEPVSNAEQKALSDIENVIADAGIQHFSARPIGSRGVGRKIIMADARTVYM
jgi:hypothetical protein